MIAFHFIMTVVLFLCCWTLFYYFPAEIGEAAVYNQSVCASYIFLLAVFDQVYSAYKVGTYRVGALVRGQFFSSLMSWGFVYFLACVMSQRLLNPLMGLVFLLIQSGFNALWMLYTNRIYFRFHRPKRTVVFYRSKEELRKIRKNEAFRGKWRIDRCICCSSQNAVSESEGCEDVIDGDTHRVMNIIGEYEAVFVSGVSADFRNSIVEHCVATQKDCYFIPSVADVMLVEAVHIKEFSETIFQAGQSRPEPEILLLKRVFDICAAGIALLILWPLMLVIALLIKLCDRGPVIYRQTRLTKDGKEFEILKFRSMKVSAESDGVARLAAVNDERITPVGKILRANHLDELPQLVNILKGEMSVVGPRPERPEIAERYTRDLPAFELRLRVKAGLTGYAQLYGRYDTEPADKLKMDLMYINNMSLLEDLRLIFATVQVLFTRKNLQGVRMDNAASACSYAEVKMERAA